MVSMDALPKLIKEGGWIIATFLLTQKIQGDGSSTGKATRHNTRLHGE